MTTGVTGQLELALPVQGELSGTWGDTVNNGITEYTNIAIAATLTLTNDGAVTLVNTIGDASASNITSTLTGAGTVTAQFAIVRITGTLTTAKIVTFGSASAAPYSKTYLVVNAATGGAVTFKAYGQTGVSIAVGESAYVYYNGTDIVKVAGTTSGAAAGATTQVQYNNSGALAGSANLTFDGTTLTAAGLSGPLNGTVGATTANTGAFTTLSATGVATFSAGSAASPALTTTGDTNTGIFFPAADTIAFSEGGAESMRIDSSGNLGLGVTPSAWDSTYKAIQVGARSMFYGIGSEANMANNAYYNSGYKYVATSAAGLYTIDANVHKWYTAASGTAGNAITFTQQFAINSSGAIGLGSGNSTGTAGQVLTSGGASAAPTWTTASGGSTSIGLVRAIAINCILC